MRAPVKIIDLIKSDLRNESHITHSFELLITDLIYNFLLIHLDIRLGDTVGVYILAPHCCDHTDSFFQTGGFGRGARAPAPLRSDAKVPLRSGLCNMNQ